jgi:hypothetical protein
MSKHFQRNVVLLAAIFAVAAGFLLILQRPDDVATTPHPQAPAVRPPFATMRSHRQFTTSAANGSTAAIWQSAFDDVDRCAAFRKLIVNSADAQNALAWANSMNDADRPMARAAITCAWSQCDPAGAARSAAAIQDDVVTKRELMNVVFGNWAERDPNAASAFAATLGQADQTYAIPPIAWAWAAAKPNDAMQWAGSLDDEDLRDLAKQAVVATWAKEEPAAAALWAAQQPEGFARADYVQNIVAIWIKEQGNDAIEWVKQLPAGPSRDAGFDFLAEKFSFGNPSLAAGWARAIDRPELRDARLQQIASNAESQSH